MDRMTGKHEVSASPYRKAGENDDRMNRSDGSVSNFSGRAVVIHNKESHQGEGNVVKAVEYQPLSNLKRIIRRNRCVNKNLVARCSKEPLPLKPQIQGAPSAGLAVSAGFPANLQSPLDAPTGAMSKDVACGIPVKKNTQAISQDNSSTDHPINGDKKHAGDKSKSEIVKDILQKQMLILCAEGDDKNLSASELIKECKAKKISYHILEMPKSGSKNAERNQDEDNLTFQEKLETIRQFYDKEGIKDGMKSGGTALCYYLSDNFKQAFDSDACLDKDAPCKKLNHLLVQDILCDKTLSKGLSCFPLLYANAVDSSTEVEIPLGYHLYRAIDCANIRSEVRKLAKAD